MDTTAGLWLEIDQLHLKYLTHDDNVEKIQLRTKLEARVKEYLCSVTQDRKFVNSSTGDILNNSFRWISDFSLSKAAEAFQCIEKYAANLINQPWRVEYRTIKQFNGFYMHNIKSVLSGAEKLFFAMGYTRDAADPETFKLETTRTNEVNVNRDTLTTVARDCLLARMESIILQEIYSGVILQFPLSLEELFEFRRDHIGTPETAIRELVYRKNQSRFQQFNPLQQVYSQYASPLGGFTGYQGTSFPTTLVAPQGNGSFTPLQNSYQAGLFPNVPNGGVMGSVLNGGGSFPNSSGGVVAVANNPYQTGIMGQQYQISSPGLLNGYGSQPNGLLQNGMMPNGLASNGLMTNGVAGNGQIVPGMAAHVIPPSSLPSRLGGSGHGSHGGSGNRLLDHSPAGSSTSTLRQGQIPTTILDMCAGDEGRRNDSGARPRERLERVERPERVKSREFEAKDRGGGARRGRNTRGGVRTSAGDEIESWDFVYKELEQQGYSKDQAERPDILANNRNPYNPAEDVNEEDVRRNLNLMHLEETRERSRGARDKSRNRNSRDISREYGLTSESSEQEVSRYSSATSKNTDRDYRPAVQERPHRANRGQGPKHIQGATRQRVQEGQDKWECGACTYHNAMAATICEMCSKTKEKSYKTTLVDAIQSKQDDVDGGRRGDQCSRCTLVNPPNTKVCEACGASLGLSPPI